MVNGNPASASPSHVPEGIVQGPGQASVALHVAGMPLLAFHYLVQEFVFANREGSNALSLTGHLHHSLISLYESSFDKKTTSMKSVGVAQGQLKEE